MSVRELASGWRADADVMRRRGCGDQADLLLAVAEELEDAIAREDNELLLLAAAARISDYSASQLRRLVATGALESVGANGVLMLRRGDLPRKPAGKRADLSKAVKAVVRLRKSALLG